MLNQILAIIIAIITIITFVLFGIKIKEKEGEENKEKEEQKKIVIIGGGIAGLTAAYNLSKDKNNKVTIFEKERLGGRAYQVKWHGVDIDYGAGIIRENDKNIIKLCGEIGIQLYPSKTDLGWKSLNYPKLSNDELKEIIKKVQDKFNETKQESSKLTFKQFLDKHFSNSDQIIKHIGYTDMLDADVESTIYNYPITDILLDNRPYFWPAGGPGAIPAKLVEILQQRSNVKIIMQGVDKININEMKVWAPEVITCDKIILAITLHPLQQLLKNSGIVLKELDGIGNVEFIRGFSYVDGLPKLPGFTITDTPNQRVIPISNGVIMSIYADNDYAKYWKNKSDAEMSQLAINNINSDFNLQLQAKDFTKKYWQDGIHYYKPGYGDLVKKIRKPFQEDVYIIGEMVSINQGWMEGAVETAVWN